MLSAKTMILGVQMLFVAFGSLVLVPLLTGMDPSIALFTSGVGTLVFHLITRMKVPVYLASSFAFIAPIQLCVTHYGMGSTLGALAAVGLVYLLLALVAKVEGHAAIHKFLPPIVTGPVIMTIGLKLAPVAVFMAQGKSGDGAVELMPYGYAIVISLVSVLTVIVMVVKGGKFFSLIPVLCGIVAGYLMSLILCLFAPEGVSLVNFEAIRNATWFSCPWVDAIATGRYEFPVFNLEAILFMLPVAIAPAIEHIGDVLAISSVTGKDFLEDPGLERTLAGDGVATTIAALLGGPPNTTYSEVTGAVALTKSFNPVYMVIAAVTAIVLAFVGKLGVVLQMTPTPVMGGILIVLFGMIAAVGIGSLVRARTDLNDSRNLIIVSVILVLGIGGMEIDIGNFMFGGIGLAGLVGIVLNMVLPRKKQNEEEK